MLAASIPADPAKSLAMLRRLVGSNLSVGDRGRRFPKSLAAEFDRSTAEVNSAKDVLREWLSETPNQWFVYQTHRDADARSLSAIFEQEILFSAFLATDRLLSVLPRCHGRSLDEAIALLEQAEILIDPQDSMPPATFRMTGHGEPYRSLLTVTVNRVIFFRALAAAILALENTSIEPKDQLVLTCLDHNGVVCQLTRAEDFSAVSCTRADSPTQNDFCFTDNERRAFELLWKTAGRRPKGVDGAELTKDSGSQNPTQVFRSKRGGQEFYREFIEKERGRYWIRLAEAPDFPPALILHQH